MRAATIMLITVAMAVLVPVRPASALNISQWDPDGSLATTSWAVQSFNDHIEVNLTTALLTSDMIEYPLTLVFTLQAGDAGKPIWLVNNTPTDVGMASQNSTGVAWGSVQFGLVNMPVGFPTYSAAAFSTSTAVGSNQFRSVDVSSDTVYFSDGLVLDGSGANFKGMVITDTGSTGGMFRLEQYVTDAVIPEPATLSLLAAGGLLWLGRRRASRK